MHTGVYTYIHVWYAYLDTRIYMGIRCFMMYTITLKQRILLTNVAKAPA
jgi:hypothetical protein